MESAGLGKGMKINPGLKLAGYALALRLQQASSARARLNGAKFRP